MPTQITGTFLDEITWDIPSQNWGETEWRREFAIMRSIGIDTVIIIRGGLRRMSVFPSEIVGNKDVPDLASLFLSAAEENDMKLYFGTYDSGEVHERNWENWRAEFELNKKFVEEVLNRYSGHPAFHGWYISHEVGFYKEEIRLFFKSIGEFLKETTPEKPILLSPYYPCTEINFKTVMLKSVSEFADDWAKILSENKYIDHCAFQDGTARIEQLEEYTKAIKCVCDAAGVDLWNNTETFARNMPIRFLPIDYRLLSEKLRVTSPYVTKQITFEFSHFMSPQSMYISAHHLFNRYCEDTLGKIPQIPQE